MRPDPRYELAWEPQVPHSQTEHPESLAVAATLASKLSTGTTLETFKWKSIVDIKLRRKQLPKFCGIRKVQQRTLLLMASSLMIVKNLSDPGNRAKWKTYHEVVTLMNVIHGLEGRRGKHSLMTITRNVSFNTWLQQVHFTPGRGRRSVNR